MKKQYDNILQKSFLKRFVALTNLGLIVLDEPQGKPLEIINPLFSVIEEFNYKKEYCFELTIGKIKHIFSVKNNNLRKRWKDELEKWTLSIYNDEIVTI